jgi:nitroreductase
MSQTRNVENGVNPIFVERWSPRAYDGSEISNDELKPLFEAAHWAPSAYNAQPWRFVYARRGTPQWQSFLATLIPYNRDWVQHASVIVFAVSARRFVPPGKSEAISTGYESYDTGAAVAFFALQASLSGLSARIIAGYDKTAVRQALDIPEGFEVESAVIVGRRGKADSLPPDLQARETPTPRQPAATLVAEGRFAFKEA